MKITKLLKQTNYRETSAPWKKEEPALVDGLSRSSKEATANQKQISKNGWRLNKRTNKTTIIQFKSPMKVCESYQTIIWLQRCKKRVMRKLMKFVKQQFQSHLGLQFRLKLRKTDKPDSNQWRIQCWTLKFLKILIVHLRIRNISSQIIRYFMPIKLK